MSAVDYEVGARDVAGVVRGEKQRHARNVLRPPEAAQGDLLDEPLAPRGVTEAGRSERGLGDPGADRVHAYRMGSELDGQGLCEHPDGALGGVVMDLRVPGAGENRYRLYGGEVDHALGRPRGRRVGDHGSSCGLAEEKRACHVHPLHLVPFLQGEVEKLRMAHYPGAVDENVERTELLEGK